MKCIGIYSGDLYSDEDYKSNKIKECCICVDPALDNDEGIAQTKTKAEIQRLLKCSDCYSCERSQVGRT